MNIRMYTAAREATTKARNVASAIQQAQRQVNDDNKDISEKVDKNQQLRDKKKAQLELESAKIQKDLAQKQLNITQLQAAVATVMAFANLVGAAVNMVQKIKGMNKPKDGTTGSTGSTEVGGQRPDFSHLRGLEQGAGEASKGKAHQRDNVRELQRQLENNGYSVGPKGVDGFMGPDTTAALRNFQRDNGLEVNGKVDEATQRKLEEKAATRGTPGSTAAGGPTGSTAVGGPTGSTAAGGPTGSTAVGGPTGSSITSQNNPTQQGSNNTGEQRGILQKISDYFAGGSTAEERAASRQQMNEIRELIMMLAKALGFQQATAGALGKISGQLKSLGELVTTGEYNVRDDNGQVVRNADGSVQREEAGVLGKAIHKAVGEPLAKAGRTAMNAVAGAIGTVVTGATLVATSAIATAGTAVGTAMLGGTEGAGNAMGANGNNTAGRDGSSAMNQIGAAWSRFIGGGDQNAGQTQGNNSGNTPVLDRALSQLPANGGFSEAQANQFREAVRQTFQNAMVSDGQGGERRLSAQEIDQRINNMLAGAALSNLGQITANADGSLTLIADGKSLNISKEMVTQLARGGAATQQALGSVQAALSSTNAGQTATLGVDNQGGVTLTQGNTTTNLTTGPLVVRSTLTPTVNPPQQEEADPTQRAVAQLQAAGLAVTNEGGKIKLGGQEITADQAKALADLASQGVDLSRAKLTVGQNGSVSATVGNLSVSVAGNGTLSAQVGGAGISTQQLNTLLDLSAKGVDLSRASLAAGSDGVTANLGALSLKVASDGSMKTSIGGREASVTAAQMQTLVQLQQQGANLSGLSVGANGELNLALGQGKTAALSNNGTISIGGKEVSIAQAQAIQALGAQGVSLANLSIGDNRSVSLSVGGASATIAADGKISVGSAQNLTVAQATAQLGALSFSSLETGATTANDAQRKVLGALGDAGRGATIGADGSLTLANGAKLSAEAVNVLAGGIDTSGQAMGNAKAVLGLVANQGISITNLTGMTPQNAGQTGGAIGITGTNAQGVTNNLNLDQASVAALLQGGARGQAVADAVKAGLTINNAVASATGNNNAPSISIAFDASKASEPGQGITLNVGGQAVDNQVVQSLAQGAGQGIAAQLANLGGRLGLGDNTQRFAALAQVGAAGLEGARFGSNGEITGTIGGQSVTLGADAVQGLRGSEISQRLANGINAATRGLGQVLNIATLGTFSDPNAPSTPNQPNNQILSNIGTLRSQQQAGQNVDGAQISLTGITGAGTGTGTQTTTPSRNAGLAALGTQGLNIQAPSNTGNQPRGSILGRLFAGTTDSARDLASSVQGANNPLVGLFTGDVSNGRAARNIPESLRERALGDVMQTINNDQGLKDALASGNRQQVADRLAALGVIANPQADISAFVSQSRNSNALSLNTSAVRNAVNGQLNVVSQAGANGGSTFTVSRTDAAGQSTNLGEVSISREGQISGRGEQTGSRIASGANNQRREAVADALNAQLRAFESRSGTSRIGPRFSASDIQLDANGNIAGVKFEGRSMSLEEFARLRGGGEALGRNLNNAATNAINGVNQQVANGGENNRLAQTVNQTLASFRAAGVNTDNARISYGQDGKATITLANGQSIGVDEHGQLFDPTVQGAANTINRTVGANGNQTYAGNAALQRIFNGATRDGKTVDQVLERFSQNQNEADRLRQQLDKSFSFSLFSGRQGGDRVGAAIFGVLSLGLGELFLRMGANQSTKNITFSYDAEGNISGARVEFSNGNTLNLARDTRTGQYSMASDPANSDGSAYNFQNTGVDNTRGLLNFLNTTREANTTEALGRLGITVNSIETSDNPNQPLANPTQGQARPDYNPYNDAFAQESNVNVSVGGQNFRVQVDYDRNGGVFVNTEGLNALNQDQKNALVQGVRGSLAREIIADTQLNQALSSGNTQAAQQRLNQILQARGLQSVDAQGNVTGLQLNINDIAQGGQIQESNLNASLNQKLNFDNAVDAVRSALGGRVMTLSEGQIRQAEQDVINSFRDSGFENVRFATNDITRLAGNADFQALANGTLDPSKVGAYLQQTGLANNASQQDIARALLRQAEQRSGLNQGVFRLEDIQGKSADQLRQEFGSVQVSAGYDGRTARIQATNITALGTAGDYQTNRATEDKATRVVQGLLRNNDFRALAEGRADQATIDRIRQDLSQGPNAVALPPDASQGQIAQAMLDRALTAEGIPNATVNRDGKFISIDQLMNTSYGQRALVGSSGAGGRTLIDPNGARAAVVASGIAGGGANSTVLRELTVTMDSNGRRSISMISSDPSGRLQQSVNQRFPANEGPSTGKRVLDGMVKGLAESMPELLKALQALKKALEDLEEARIKLAAAQDQLKAAQKYAAEMGVVPGLGDAGGGQGGAAVLMGMAAEVNSNQRIGQGPQGAQDGKGSQGAQPGQTGEPATPGQVAAELLAQVASDAGFANMAVLLGLQPGLLIHQAQQADMLEELSQVIKQLQSPFGDPIQQMQQFLDLLKQRTGLEVTPPSDMIPLGG